MKKLLLLIAAILPMPMITSSVCAKEMPTKIQKFSELNQKGLDRWANQPQKYVGLQRGSLSFDSSKGAKVAKATSTAKDQTFKCGLLYSDKWLSENLYGVYSFYASDINSIETLYINKNAQANAGGFFTEDKYYFTDYERVDGESSVITYVVNTSTWSLEKTIDHEDDTYAVAYSMAYDPIEKVAFGSFYNGDESSSYWGYMDLSSGDTQLIKQLDCILVATAITDQGDVYAIDSNGQLVSVAKYTGELTVLKQLTSSVTTDYQQAAAISEDGSTMYWAIVTTGNGLATGLITIDLTTNTVTGVEQFEDSEYIGALYCNPAAADEGAPANPSNLKLNFVDDSLTGTINFDVPAVDNLGADITGNVTYIIYVDGEQYSTGETAAGATATVTVKVAKAGVHTIAVRLQNEKGLSSRIIASQWIGIDRPVAVTNLALVKDGNKANLTWTAPTKGALDGYFDAARLNYKIIRLSDNKVVAQDLKATSFTDDLSDLTEPVYVSYSVTACADDVEGATVTSDGAVFGPAYQVSAQNPVVFDLDTQANFNLFTIVDVNKNLNEDDGCWQYSPSAGCAGYVSGTKDGDDWFISPDIYLKADRQYIFSFDMQSYGGSYWPDKYEVYMGQGVTADAMTKQLVAPTVIYWEEYRNVSVVITVEKDGNYNFGFHGLTEADGRFCMLDNIMVEESYNLKAPVAVSDLSVVAGDEGALSATVSFTTPTKTVDGSDITTLASAKVYRGTTLVKEFENPAVGAKLSFEESGLTSGYATYKVVAATTSGEGVAASEKAWVGLDTPKAPTAHMSFDGVNPVISWDAPQGRGANGGYVNIANLSYAVYNVSSQSILVQGSKEFSFKDTNFEYDGEGDQEFFEYGVFAYNAAGTSEAGTTFFINGEKYPLPFKESFANGTTDKLLLINTTSSSSSDSSYDRWYFGSDTAADTDSQDEDGGYIMILPSTPGVESGIQMGKIDMTGAKNSALTFCVKRMDYDNDYPETDPQDDALEVYIGGADYETSLVKTVRPYDLKSGKYTTYNIPLTEYEGKDFIFLQFKMKAGAAYYPVVLDNVQVRNYYAKNLTATSISAPSSVTVTNDFTVNVTVTNDGSEAVKDFTVQVKAGKDVVATKTDSDELASGASRNYVFDLNALSTWSDEQTLSLVVTVDGDEYADDDTVETTLSVVRPTVAAVDDLDVTYTETEATFTWSAPAIATTEKVVDSFESYEFGKMKTGDVGEWTLVDEDGSWGLSEEIYNTLTVPGEYSSTRSWQVFDQKGTDTKATWVEDDENWAAHSGDKMIIALGNGDGSNDDWLVSPKLSGKAQTISFWARGFNSKDKLYVQATSSANIDVDDFESLKTIKLSTEWTKYEVELEEGTQYFAINYSCRSGFAALVDDIEFEKVATYVVQPVVEGYNIYCDGQKLNDALITDTTYKISGTVQSGAYYVTTIYNVGESDASNTVLVSTSGVNDITVDDADVNAPTYDLYGRRVYNLQPGRVYIRKNQKFVYRK